MNIGAWSLRNRAVVLAAIIIAAVGGIFAATTLPSGIYPELDFPRIVVVARGGDAPPDVFMTTVTRPLEQSLATVLGVRRVRSRTIRGTTEISLLFVAGSDMWRALQLVQSQVNNTRASLPANLEIEVERLTPTAFPVVTFNLAGSADPRDLHDLAELVVRPALARVPGVGLVRVLGGDTREFEVIVDPVRAAAVRVRPPDIAARVRDEVALAAVGRLDRDRQLVTVMASGEARTLEDLGAVPIALTAGGAAVPLGSIARIVEGATDRTARVGGPRGETVLISVSRTEGASTPDVVHGVMDAARDVARAFPSGVTMEPVYDQAALVTESVASVRDAILVGIVLCLITLGLSLRDLRAGLVAAIAVPLVLAATFLVMKALHQTLNLMSLGGMAVAIGLVIDDAIIVVEAIARRLEEGAQPEMAAETGTNDLAAAVIGTTVTTVVVFVPLAFVQGIVGDFFSALAGTLSAAVVLSLIVSLTGVPVAAALWMRARKHPERVSRLERGYGAVANWGAHRRWLGLAMVLFSIGAAAWLAGHVESGFLPSMDEGAFVLDYFLPAGTSLAETDRAARDLEHILRTTPDVRTYSRRTGAELGPAAATALNRGDIMVRLVDSKHRNHTADEVIDAVRARAAAEVPAARVEFVQVLQDVLNDLSGAPRPIEIKVFGEDPAVLAEIAHRVTERIGHIHGIADLYSGVEAETPTLVFRVDREAAARVHRTSQDILNELASTLAGVPAGAVRRLDRLIPIRVRYPDSVRFDAEALADLPIVFDAPLPGGTAGTIPLRAIATPTSERVPSQLMHEGLQPVVIVTADREGRDLGSIVRDVQATLAGVHLPAGYRMEIGGQYESQQETFRNLAMVTGFGLLLTLLVLIAQFRRVRPALAIMCTTPFALVGALVTLWATHTPLNASSLMGCVLLVGLEVKTGILLLEVAEEHAAAGQSYVQALANAGRRRIRPIMLTTTATMFGVLPLALGIGAGAEIQRPLAIAVLGGITVSKFLNLVALPSLAVLFAGHRDATREVTAAVRYDPPAA